MKRNFTLLCMLSMTLCNSSYSMWRPPFQESTHSDEDVSSSHASLKSVGLALQKHAQNNDVEGIEFSFETVKYFHLISGPHAMKHLKVYAALYHAVNYGNYEATKCLLESRMINLKSDPNYLLHMVCFGKWHEDEKKTKEIIQHMLAAGADINTLNKQKLTPLNIACGFSYAPDFVKDAAPKSVQDFLIDQGAQKAIPKLDMSNWSKPATHESQVVYGPRSSEFNRCVGERRLFPGSYMSVEKR